MDGERRYITKSIAESIAEADASGTDYVAVTFHNCAHVEGPFFHGTKTAFSTGDLLTPGFAMNVDQDRVANHVYFATLLEPAVWAAELASALDGNIHPGRVYVVEPTGPFEDDPNVTNKKFPGNVTRSYRTRHAMRVIEEVHAWESHAAPVLQAMIDNLARLREQGLDVIED